MPAKFEGIPMAVKTTFIGHPLSAHMHTKLDLRETSPQRPRAGSLVSYVMSKLRLGSSSDTIGSRPTETMEKVSMKYVWDIYKTSPIMPTYTVAMAVLKDYMKSHSFKTRGKQVNYWPMPERFNKSRNREAINDRIPKFWSFLESYTNKKDGILKMDIVEVDARGPRGRGGAMENWGMVTLRIPDTYIDFNISIAWEPLSILFAHEIAHSWFGNMVTCKDWSE